MWIVWRTYSPFSGTEYLNSRPWRSNAVNKSDDESFRIVFSNIILNHVWKKQELSPVRTRIIWSTNHIWYYVFMNKSISYKSRQIVDSIIFTQSRTDKHSKIIVYTTWNISDIPISFQILWFYFWRGVNFLTENLKIVHIVGWASRDGHPMYMVFTGIKEIVCTIIYENRNSMGKDRFRSIKRVESKSCKSIEFYPIGV